MRSVAVLDDICKTMVRVDTHAARHAWGKLGLALPTEAEATSPAAGFGATPRIDPPERRLRPARTGVT